MNVSERISCLSGFQLKCIAILSMALDHTGAVLFPQEIWLRCAGRLAFPIFCFLIVEGFVHTHDVYRYMARLGVFALISEIPYDLAFRGVCLEFAYQNVFFTLSISLVMLVFLERAMDACQRKRQAGEKAFLQTLAAVGTVAAAMAAAELFCVDYGGSGPLLAALFYCYKRKGSPGLAVSFLIFCLSMGLLTAMVEIFGIVSVPLIARYNGKRTGRGRGRLFYLFYPLHLLILYGISMLGKNMLA